MSKYIDNLSNNRNKNIVTSHFRLTEGRLVTCGIIGMIAVFAVLIFFVGAGGVRHVPITFEERIETTVAFRNIDGETKVVGLKGNTQVNPTLVSRIGDDTIYALTVVNQDNDLHMLYIDGLNLHTKILRPGESDTIIIYPRGEGSYNYYDSRSTIVTDDENEKTIMKFLGEFRTVKVAGDE
jgi:hypothetical protein